MADVAVVEDPVGKEIDEQIRANVALLAGLKYEYGQALLQAQQGEGDPPAPGTLAAIKKLEAGITSDRMFQQARAMTMRRRRPAA